jgi:hypothetical protein
VSRSRRFPTSKVTDHWCEPASVGAECSPFCGGTCRSSIGWRRTSRRFRANLLAHARAPPDRADLLRTYERCRLRADLLAVASWRHRRCHRPSGPSNSLHLPARSGECAPGTVQLTSRARPVRRMCAWDRPTHFTCPPGQANVRLGPRIWLHSDDRAGEWVAFRDPMAAFGLRVDVRVRRAGGPDVRVGVRGDRTYGSACGGTGRTGRRAGVADRTYRGAERDTGVRSARTGGADRTYGGRGVDVRRAQVDPADTDWTAFAPTCPACAGPPRPRGRRPHLA